MIYDKEPIQVLWDLLKDLSEDIPIYKEVMHEDENSTPFSYILLVSQVTDTTQVYGDGESVIRNADCDIHLVTKGFADDSTDIHNINKRKVRQLLKAQKVSFEEYNLGYNESLKSTEHTFSLGVAYIG